MNAAIFWTPEAERTFGENLDYLSKEWDSAVINDFLDRVEEALELISSNPELYRVHNVTHNIRRCVIHERIILYYRIVNSNQIHLLTFWNTAKNPNDLRL